LTSREAAQEVRTDKEGASVSYVFEVYYKSPADPKREYALLEQVSELGGRLDYREEPKSEPRGSICLTYEFDDSEQAAAAVESLRKQGEYVEGPQDYGEQRMNTTNDAARKRWTATELRKLPPAERDALMKAAAALAEEEYRNDPELTDFEAFGKDDLYGESSSTETR
jgi:hypothetical protein